MKIFKMFFILLVFFNSCKSDKKVVIDFGDQIDRYNYLDKPHKLEYIYDFETLFSENESKKLFDKLVTINKEKKLTIVVVSDKKPLNQSFIKTAKITNGIFKNKYNLEKIITVMINKSSRKVAIAYSNELNDKINDSLCDIIIKNTLKPNLKKEKYFKGVNSSIDSLLNYLK